MTEATDIEGLVEHLRVLHTKARADQWWLDDGVEHTQHGEAQARPISIFHRSDGEDYFVAEFDNHDVAVLVMDCATIVPTVINALTAAEAERDRLAKALDEIIRFPHVGLQAALEVQRIARTALSSLRQSSDDGEG